MYNVISDVNLLFTLSSTELIRSACLFVGHVGSTCLDLLLAQKTALGAFVDLYRESLGDRRVLMLQCLSFILKSKDGKKVFSMLPGLMEALIKDGRNSFDDIRLGACTCLDEMSMHEWGVRELAGDVRFSGFICDRFGDDTKGGAEFRFELIKRLVGTTGVEGIFGDADLKLFKAYMKEGAFYREIVVSVAVEPM
jgi:hypothetical protein